MKFIVEELISLSGMSTNYLLELEKINDDLAAENAELKDVRDKIAKYEKLFQAKAELLGFRQTQSPFGKIQSAITEIKQYLDNFTVFDSFDLNVAYKEKDLKKIETQKGILDALTFSSSRTSSSAIKKQAEFNNTKDALNRGFDSLIKYLNELQSLSISIEDAEKLDNRKLEKTETELETKIADLNDKLKKLNSKKKISPAFIGDTTPSANFTNTTVLKALSETTADYK